MFGSGVLDTAIGLIFVFLLVSLLVTIVNEMIAGILLSRAKWLRLGIERMVGTAWARRLYDHPLIEGSGEEDSAATSDRGWRGSGPSYIASRSFANVLLDLVRDGDAARTGVAGRTPARGLREAIEGLSDPRIRRTLVVLLDDAEDDVERFKQNVEVWFDNSMDRVGGWYKRRSQLVIGIVATVCVVALNIDALLIVDHLETHPGVRDALVAQAKTGAQTPPVATGSVQSFESVEVRLSQLGMPIGWVLERPTPSDVRDRLAWPDVRALGDTVRFHLLGWLITIIAATLGAPFWFDMLNRAISVRLAGKSPEEQPKAPKTVPAPLEPGQSPAEADAVAAIAAGQKAR